MLPPAESQPRLGEHPPDEGALAVRVRLEVIWMLLREAELQGPVFGGELRVGPQGVAEGEPLQPEVAPGLGQVYADARLRETMRDVGTVTRVLPAVRLQRLVGGPGLLERGNPGHH